MKCEFGYCTVCEKEIAKLCNSCTHKMPTKDYTEVEVQWSNGSRMRIAVCVDCATSHAWTKPEVKDGITKAHWRHWDKTHAVYDKEVVIV